MKLLITTQAVDKNDPVLGFFVQWIEEFAKHCEHVTVMCLRKGQYHLPPNVKVYSAGKERGLLRILRWVNTLRYIVVLRHEYDVVFVHMNPEYLVLGGCLWHLWGKKIGFWYMHKSVNLKLRIAERLTHFVCTGSKESFRLSTQKLHVLGHGIDTNFFTPDPAASREEWWLSVGRLNKSKRHDVAIQMAHGAGKLLHVVGGGPEREHLEAHAQKLGARVVFTGPLVGTELREQYRKAGLFIHTSETGSLDKVVLEAIACGCPLKTNDPALKYLEKEGWEYVRREHSLQNLIPRIVALYGAK